MEQNKKLKILLADDHGLFRDSMAVWLDQFEQPVDVHFSSDWASTERQLAEPFDVILLDLAMPGMHGVARIVEIRQLHPDTPLIIVSANQNRHTIELCFQAGVSGYITKSSNGADILRGIAAVLAGEPFRSADISACNLGASGLALSQKQIVLLGHLAAGLSNRDIAATMFLAEGTVKQYVSQLLRLLNVDNRTQASVKARALLGVDI